MKKQTARPNVLFIIADDHRFDALGAMGHTQIKTPHLDRLAAEGAHFRRAHMPSGNSGAICMPSRAMLHTGRTLFHIGGDGAKLMPDHALMGETFRQSGYHTFGTGKWHNCHASFNRSFADGNEIFFGGMCDHWNMPAYRYDSSGQYASRIPRCVDARTSKELQYTPGDHIHGGRHSTDVIADAALQFLHHYKDDKPWLLYAAFLAPHDPRTMPEQYRALYKTEDIELPANFMPEHPFDNGVLDIRDEQLAPRPRTPDLVKEHIADYYAMLTHMDDRIGDIRRAIEARGEWENTIVVYTADHGLAVGRHGLMGKQNLYDHSIRVPMIIKGPGVPQGLRHDAFCFMMDAHPTICELAGVPVGDTVEAQSLIPLMNDLSASGRDIMYFAYTDKHRGVRQGDWKYIEYRPPEAPPRAQLFNVEQDPDELHDYSSDPDQQMRLQELRALLISESQKLEDTLTPWGQQFWARPGP